MSRKITIDPCCRQGYDLAGAGSLAAAWCAGCGRFLTIECVANIVSKRPSRAKRTKRRNSRDKV